MFISNTEKEKREMLEAVGARSVKDLFKDIDESLFAKNFNLPPAKTEAELTAAVKKAAALNKPLLNFAGAGIYEHFIPAAVGAISSRGEFLTAYTPYQAEASQGTLQAIYEYQSCICALFEMGVSNASHYDGATALAEACGAACKIKNKNKVLLSAALNPEYKKVLNTYFKSSGAVNFEQSPLENGTVDLAELKKLLSGGEYAAFVLSNPNFYGCLEDAREISRAAHEAGSLLIAQVNPISLGALEMPGSYDADFAVAEGQCLGNTMSFGGPGLGIFTCKKEYVRYVPGRICGMAKDADGKRAFVLTLQAREQHIRRERASSNICSNQALCALNAAIYLTLMGPFGMRDVAEANIENAHILKDMLCSAEGYKLKFDKPFFNEFTLECPKPAAQIIKAAAKKGILAGYDLGRTDKNLKNCLLVCATEVKTKADLEAFASALRGI